MLRSKFSKMMINEAALDSHVSESSYQKARPITLTAVEVTEVTCARNAFGTRSRTTRKLTFT
jgi:alkylhydroperoxidase family enzyme